jgi:hypothetical protein
MPTATDALKEPITTISYSKSFWRFWPCKKEICTERNVEKFNDRYKSKWSVVDVCWYRDGKIEVLTGQS